MLAKEKYISWAERNSNQLPLFYRPWWLNAVCIKWDVALVEEEETIVAIWPYNIDQKAGLTLLRNPLLTPYLGPLLLAYEHNGYAALDREELLLNKLLLQLPKYAQLVFSTVPSFMNFLPFRHKGMNTELKLTYKIDLRQTEDQLKEKIQSRTLRYINTYHKKVSIAPHEGSLAHFLALHRATYAQNKSHYPYQPAFLENLIQQGKEHDATLLCATQENEILGYLWVANDHDTMYQLLSCYNHDKQQHGLMSALTFYAIRLAQSRGLRWFDMEGSVHPGIEPFFRKFGGERFYYLSITHTPSLTWQLKKAIFR